MPKSRRLSLAIALFVLACSSLPLSIPRRHPTRAAPDVTPSMVAAIAPQLLATDSISPIPLQAGYGARGPWFEIYFTNPADRFSAQQTGGVDAALVDAIDEARLSAHLAIYSFSLNSVRDALIRAFRRGLDVRVVTESDNLDSEDLQRLKDAGIPTLGDRREGSMHNKFMVLDGSEVWTGSMNFTGSGAYLDNNVLLHITSSDLGANYETEFSEMFEDDKFGPDAGRATPHAAVQIGGTLLTSYFSPDDEIETQLSDLLDTARTSLYFLAYSLTSDPLGEAIHRAQDAGITVQGVLDEDQSSSNAGSELPRLQAAGVDVRLDGNPGQMHEKVFIIDGEVVVVGSYNFSRNASRTNDENVLVIYNRPIAELFMREFRRVYDQAAH